MFTLKFTEVASVTYPKAYQDFLNILNIFNIDSWAISAGCMTYYMDFHLRFLIMTIGPILTVPILAGTYLYVVNRHGASGETLEYAWQKHVSSILFIMFFVYTGASSMTFSMFSCNLVDDDHAYLRVDYNIECSGLKHKALIAFAGLMILVYPLGIPAFFAFLLIKNRRVLLNKALRENAISVRAFSDLWKPYKPSRFYFEAIDCVRRLGLMALGYFTYPDTAAQIAVTLMVAVVFALMSEGLAPYEYKLDMWVSRLGHAVIILSMYFALLLEVNVLDDSQGSQHMFEIIIIATHLLLILTATTEACLTGYSLSNGQVEDPWPRLRYRPRLRSVSGSFARTSLTNHIGGTEIELSPPARGGNPNNSVRSECEHGGSTLQIEPTIVRSEPL